jgi:hypothetical protein
VTPEELQEFLAESRSPERERALREAAAKLRLWEQSHPHTLDGILDWIDQLRAIFGEPPVDPRPWVGNDFRL